LRLRLRQYHGWEFLKFNGTVAVQAETVTLGVHCIALLDLSQSTSGCGNRCAKATPPLCAAGTSRDIVYASRGVIYFDDICHLTASVSIVPAEYPYTGHRNYDKSSFDPGTIYTSATPSATNQCHPPVSLHTHTHTHTPVLTRSIRLTPRRHHAAGCQGTHLAAICPRREPRLQRSLRQCPLQGLCTEAISLGVGTTLQ
jgi:hypothetical protein